MIATDTPGATTVASRTASDSPKCLCPLVLAARRVTRPRGEWRCIYSVRPLPSNGPRVPSSGVTEQGVRSDSELAKVSDACLALWVEVLL